MNTSKTLYEMFATLAGFSKDRVIEWFNSLTPEHQEKLMKVLIEKNEDWILDGADA